MSVNYYGVNGRTGKKFDESFSRGQAVTFSLAQVVPGFSKGLTGQKQGSRVLIAMPGSDGYDASGGSPQAGIEVGDTLIFVVDIEATTLSGPEGVAGRAEGRACRRSSDKRQGCARGRRSPRRLRRRRWWCSR